MGFCHKEARIFLFSGNFRCGWAAFAPHHSLGSAEVLLQGDVGKAHFPEQKGDLPGIEFVAFKEQPSARCEPLLRKMRDGAVEEQGVVALDEKGFVWFMGQYVFGHEVLLLALHVGRVTQDEIESGPMSGYRFGLQDVGLDEGVLAFAQQGVGIFEGYG